MPELEKDDFQFPDEKQELSVTMEKETSEDKFEVEIEDDNPKLKELVEGDIPSHHDYSKSLKDGIMSVL